MSGWVLSLHASVKHMPDPEKPRKAWCSWSAVQTERDREDYGMPHVDAERLPLCRHCARKMAQRG